MGRPVVYWELMSRDPAKVAAFYEKVFDWNIQSRKIENRPQMNYRMVDTDAGQGINGGIVRPEREGPWPGNMTIYIDVDDLAPYRKRIVDAGGKILVDEQQVGDMASLTLFADPEGRMMGLWKAKPH